MFLVDNNAKVCYVYCVRNIVNVADVSNVANVTHIRKVGQLEENCCSKPERWYW